MGSELNILVLAGGISHERDVSLRSGRRVADGLKSVGHTVELRDPDASLLAYLRDSRPDVVFPVLHGAGGEDGTIVGLLTGLGIPTVGSDATAARLAWFKPTASSIVKRAGIATPNSIVLSHTAFRELGAAEVLQSVKALFPGDIVVKPQSGGSAQGVSVVANPDDLTRAMVDAFSYAEAAVIEQRIHGVEVAVTVLEDRGAVTTRALPPVEIVPNEGIYGFQARYNAGETTFFTPARLPTAFIEAVSSTAVEVHKVLGLRDLSRVDFIIDETGIPWFLEANTMPGMTETSLVPLAMAAAGLNPGEVYAQLTQNAIIRNR